MVLYWFSTVALHFLHFMKIKYNLLPFHGYYDSMTKAPVGCDRVLSQFLTIGEFSIRNQSI